MNIIIPPMQKLFNSTNLTEVGYDEEQHRLYIKFSRGHIYRYLNVPRTVYEGLIAAESPGGYFRTAIRQRFSGDLIDQGQDLRRKDFRRI